MNLITSRDKVPTQEQVSSHFRTSTSLIRNNNSLKSKWNLNNLTVGLAAFQVRALINPSKILLQSQSKCLGLMLRLEIIGEVFKKVFHQKGMPDIIMKNLMIRCRFKKSQMDISMN